ncbi:TIGR03086 family metal-binding protein [Actinocrispum sp. NPDC049592]|uniref:TIGR03086 family metal-binding protein n=1 Tax=Actinocrispum sp. NPDC049592 TaxID=3154835 RepID=UPI003419E4AC
MTPLLSGGVGLLERAIGYTLGSLQLVTPAAMSQPTPCRDWDLEALLHHMNDSLAALHEAVDSGYVGLEPAAGAPAADLVAALKDRACRLLGAWTNGERDRVAIADRELTGLMVTSAGALEIAVHGWDVARACGVDRPIPDRLAVRLMRLSLLFVPPQDRPGRFAPPLPPEKDSGASGELLAFLGRMK